MVRVPSSLQEIAIEEKGQILLHLLGIEIASVHDSGLYGTFHALRKDQPDNFNPAPLPFACVKALFDKGRGVSLLIRGLRSRQIMFPPIFLLS